jgi:hypothetical protein
MNVVVESGVLPPFVPRGVLFFANLRSLFFGNLEQTRVLEHEVLGIASYGGRLTAVLDLLFPGGENVLFLEKRPGPALVTYFSSLGLRLPALVEAEDASRSASIARAAEFREHPARWVDGFVTDRALEETARSLGKRTVNTSHGSRDSNDKVRLARFLEETGFPVFDSLIIQHRGEFTEAAKELRRRGYRFAVLKSAIGASGCGMCKIDLTGPASPPDYLFHDPEALLQGWIDETTPGVEVIGSPSVQFYITENEVHFFDLTEQILSRACVHEGNIAPPPWIASYPDLREELFRQASTIGRFIHGTGYRGTGGVDFLAIRRNGHVDAYACEVNARVTGATYPALLARHFCPDGAWTMRNLVFPRDLSEDELLEKLDAAGLLFHRGREAGILPFNFSPAGSSAEALMKGQFVSLAPDPETSVAGIGRACDVLGVERFDRD